MSEPAFTFDADSDTGVYMTTGKEGYHWDATAGERDPFFPGHMSGDWVKDEEADDE